MYTEEDLDKGNIREQFLSLAPSEQQKAFDELPVYSKRVVLATLAGDEHGSNVMHAFADLCHTLAAELAQRPEYEGAKIGVVMTANDIRRPATEAEMIDKIVSGIWSERYNANTKEQQLLDIQAAKKDFQAAVRGDEAWQVPGYDPAAKQ